MTSIKITIINNSGDNQKFLLFHSVPERSRISGQDFSNVYLKSPLIPTSFDVKNPHSHASFTVPTKYYAVYSTISESSDGSTMITSGDDIPVTLGPNGTYAVLTTINGDGVSPCWDQKAMSGQVSAAPGGFTIATDATLAKKSKIRIGVGARAAEGDAIVPIQTYAATPDTKAQIFPVPKYFITAATTTTGASLDATFFSDVLQIDFRDATKHDVTFTLNNDGTYTSGGDLKTDGIDWKVAPLPNP